MRGNNLGGPCESEYLAVQGNQAFELWSWRRVLRISRTENKTNVSVRQKIGVLV